MRRAHVFARLFTVIALTGFAPFAAAHHGWSGNEAGEIQITGVVERSVNLSGPHGRMQIRDTEGNLWNITLAPGPRTHRAGLKHGMLPVGDTVTVHGARNDDMNVFEAKVRRVIWNDQTFDVYPSN